MPGSAPDLLSVIGRAAAVLGLLLVSVIGVVEPSVASPAHPLITGGGLDGTAHPYVAMVLTPGARRPWCSGVLVWADTGSPELLTAAHCFYPGPHSGSVAVITLSKPSGIAPAGTRDTSRRGSCLRGAEGDHDLDVVFLWGECVLEG